MSPSPKTSSCSLLEKLFSSISKSCKQMVRIDEANGDARVKASTHAAIDSGNHPLSQYEMKIISGVAVGFITGMIGVYFTMPSSDYSFLKLPRNLEDLQVLRFKSIHSLKTKITLGESGFTVFLIVCRDNLEIYSSDYTIQVLMGYCMVYIFMQTFMIPGTIFMSLLAGSLFGVLKGVALVVFAATAGASSCYFLSKSVGRPIVFSIWPEKLEFFRNQVAMRRQKLLNYMLFLRLTPTLPNTFINFASPIVDVPYHTFFLATFIGLIPAAYITVKAGLAIGELQSVDELYDFNSLAALFLIGIVSISPTFIRSS